MGNNRRNRAEVPGAQNALDHLKAEVASELGIPNYENVDKGNLPSRMNGMVGGVMVRKMIEFAEEAMQGSPQAVQQVEMEPGANQRDIQVAQQSLQAANAFLDGAAGQAMQQQQMPQQMQAMLVQMPQQQFQQGVLPQQQFQQGPLQLMMPQAFPEQMQPAPATLAQMQQQLPQQQFLQ